MYAVTKGNNMKSISSTNCYLSSVCINLRSIDYICIKYINMKKSTYDSLYFLFLLGFIIVTLSLTIIRRRNFNKKYDIQPFWKNPTQSIKEVLENPLPFFIVLAFLFLIEKILIHIGIKPYPLMIG